MSFSDAIFYVGNKVCASWDQNLHKKWQKYAKKFFERIFFLTKTVQKSKIDQNTKWETLNHICFFEIKTKMRSKYNNFYMIWFSHFKKNSATFCTNSTGCKKITTT